MPEAPAEKTMPRARTRRAIFVAPLVGFAALSVVFAWGLTRDPSAIPTPLIGKPAPQFSLPPVKGRALGLSSANLIGEPSIVNVFASWCVECRLEHPLILQMQASGLAPIYGINYKDRPDDAARWLDTLGDSFARTGADLDGRAAIDWGVYGVPETFVIDAEGRIAFKQIGPLTAAIVEQTIAPLIDSLKHRAPQASQPADPTIVLAREPSRSHQPPEGKQQP